MTRPPPKAVRPKKLKRKYSSKTLKVLFGISRNECAFPDCPQPIIATKTKLSSALVVGQIAHIFALSDDGPRGCSTMTEAERNSPDYLMLFCPTHHVIVDGQHETYPAILLLEWKARHERVYQEQLGGEISELGFAELDVAARALITSSTIDSVGGLARIPPDQKIAKNGLGATSTMLLRMGAAKGADVEAIIVKTAQLDRQFPDRLREGFVRQYMKLVGQNLRGDDLFLAMYTWASGEKNERAREAAGLCILTHLFIICDVFEK